MGSPPKEYMQPGCPWEQRCDYNDRASHDQAVPECHGSRSSAIGEQRCTRMSLGERRRLARLGEVARPTPVPDLRHVLQVLSNVEIMVKKAPVKIVDDAGGLQAQPGNIP